jgi:hypothetical protein
MDMGAGSAVASATVDMAGAVDGALGGASDSDLAGDGVGAAGDLPTRIGGRRITGAIRIGDGDAQAAAIIGRLATRRIITVRTLLPRAHTRLMDTPATTAEATPDLG